VVGSLTHYKDLTIQMANDKVGSVKYLINCKAIYKQQRINRKANSEVFICVP
jgi:hypothetical protein